MPNKSSNDVFLLVKSLTKAEKRDFKKFIFSYNANLKQENKKYMELFAILDKQTTYNEGEIFRKSKLITPIQISNLKKYLFNWILKYLSFRTTKETVETKLKYQLGNLEILYNRGLYKQSMKNLIAAKKNAYKYEKYYEILEILKFEELLSKHLYNTQIYYKKLKSIGQEQSEAFTKYSHIYKYKCWQNKIIYLFNHKNSLPKNKLIKEVSKIFQYNYINEKNCALTNETKLIYYNIFSIYNFLMEKFTVARKYRSKVIALIESNKDYTLEHISDYIASILDLISIEIYLGKSNAFEKDYEKIRELIYNKKIKLPKYEKVILMFKLHNLLVSIINRKIKIYSTKSNKINKIITEFENFYLKNQHNLLVSEKTIIKLNFAVFYLNNKKYEDSLRFLNQIINSNLNEININIFITARILQFIIHYEFKNYKLLDSLIKSIQISISNKKEYNHFFNLTLILFNKILNSKDESDLKILFTKFKKNICTFKKSLGSDPGELYYALINWLDGMKL